MAANIFDLAVALVQASPQVMPQLVEALDKYLTPEQKKSLLHMQQPQAKYPLLTTSSSQIQRLHPQQEQNLLETMRFVPQQDFKPILLSVAKERHRQAKETALFVRYFLIICLITLVIGVILLFIFPPTVGGTLTVIGAFFSSKGGLVLKTHSESNKRVDEILNNIQNLRLS